MGIELSREKKNADIPWQINLAGKLEKMMVQKCFLSLKSRKNYFQLLVRFINCNRIA